MGNTSSNIGNNTIFSTYSSRCAAVPQVQHTIANATGKTIRVYYDGEKMQTGDIVEPGQHFNNSYRYISIMVNGSFSFSAEGIKYATVCLESSSSSDVSEKVIAENYEIPEGKSFIVSADHNIELEK